MSYGSAPYGSIPYGGSPLLSEPLADWLPPAGPSIYGGAVYGGFAYGGGAGVYVPPEPEPSPDTARDYDVYLDIEARLIATGAFDEVIVARDARRTRAVAEQGTIAVVTPQKRGREVAQPCPNRRLRISSYILTIEIRDMEREDAWARLDLLVAKARNALTRKSYADGLTLFQYSELSEDDYDDHQSPSTRSVLRGQFAYVIDAESGGYRDTD